MGPWISLVGMATLIGVGVVLSKDRRAINLRTVGAAFALLVSVAALVLFLPQGKAMLHTIGAGVQWVINYSYSGISFLFGDLATDKVGFVFALRVLPIIIFFSALMAVLYHIGIMQWVVRIIGAIAPGRREDAARLGMRAVAAATLANLMSATLAGFFLTF